MHVVIGVSRILIALGCRHICRLYIRLLMNCRLNGLVRDRLHVGLGIFSLRMRRCVCFRNVRVLHLVGPDLGLDSLGIFFSVVSRHVVPFISGVGAVDSAMPVEHTTGTDLCASRVESIGKRHVVAYFSHLDRLLVGRW